jgi:formylglycine-generating enzyme required for sulfatase activity
MWWIAVVLILSMLSTAPSAHAACDGVEARVRNDTRCLGPKDTFRDCVDCPEMVMVPAGSFIMGSPASEEGRRQICGRGGRMLAARVEPRTPPKER